MAGVGQRRQVDVIAVDFAVKPRLVAATFLSFSHQVGGSSWLDVFVFGRAGTRGDAYALRGLIREQTR